VRRDRSQERKRSPQDRRRQDDSRRDDRRQDNRRDDDRRKRSHSRERPSSFGNRNKGGFKQRRFNDKQEDESNYEWGKKDIKEDPDEPEIEKEAPNFGLSGKLTEETNKVNGIVIKYAEPEEAKIPKRRWRFYPFKGEKGLPTLHLHRQSAYLIGRDRKICDIAVDHPSCSKQHAALQYRLVPYTREDGSTGKRVRPYVIDLESANGTYVNNKKIDAKKYVELLEKDVVKFGFSSREYVLLHEASKDEVEDDDHDEEQQ
jgi:smad nuclear-interacting protein 1